MRAQTRSTAKAPAFRLKAPIVREPVLHKQIADAFRIELAPPGRLSREGVVWFSIDIAAYSGSVPGIRTGRGVVAGIPDILVLFEGRAHWIEVKAEDGLLSEAQRAVGSAILLSRCSYGIATDAMEAIRLLDNWDIPRAHRLRGG